MAGPNRDDPVWYYQIGGRALGPVPWREIEELLGDTFDAEELLVARAGDDEWRSADEVIAEFEADEPDEPEDEEADEEEKAPEPLTPVSGLKPWIGQGWGIIADNARDYFSASILLISLSAVSLMICLPPLHAGLYIMALKRFDGEKPESGDFVKGFQHFKSTLGLYLLLLLIGLPFGLVTTVAIALLVTALPEESGAQILLGLVSILFWLAVSLGASLPGAAAFFAVPLIVDRDMGAMEAFKVSWAVTKQDYASYLGMTLVLSLLSGLGCLLCWIGLVFTLPILPATQVCVYRYHFREKKT